MNFNHAGNSQSKRINCVWCLAIFAGCLIGCSSQSGSSPEDTEVTQPAPTDSGNSDRGVVSRQGQEMALGSGTSTDDDSTTIPFGEGMPDIRTPSVGDDDVASNADANGVPRLTDDAASDRTFTKIESVDTEAPVELVAYLKRVDEALRDLMVASSTNLLDEEDFRRQGIRLGQFKFEAANRLANAESASQEQRKQGQMAQLVALSHLSGFQDVEAAKQLEAYARQLSGSDDLDLAHQSRVVLAGFQLQALQNGVDDEPDALLASLNKLFSRPEDRGFPELMILLQAKQVLEKMGFDERANEVKDLLIAEFSQAEEPQLRAEAWSVATRDSQALQNYMQAFNNLGNDGFDRQTALAATRGLYDAFPTIGTLEQLAGTINNIEYGGYVELSRELSRFIDEKLQEHSDQPLADQVENVLANHRKRVHLLGEPMRLDDIVGFDGQPFSWDDYQGKVVLVDFWASWCGPCLQEIPTIRETYEAFHEDGFDVISISLDDPLSDAEKLLSGRDFPWRTFHPSDQERLGFDSALTERFGISNIPFMVLIDQEGEVAAIHVRGEKLSGRVRELLGLGDSLIPDEPAASEGS